MPDDAFADPSGDRDTLIRAAIGNWRDGLINLTGSNRLLNVKPSRTGSVELASALRAPYRRSTQEYLDRGLNVLYLAFGALTWTDEDGSRNTSPLLLVPVQLQHKGPRQLPTLEVSEDDPVLNPRWP